MRRALAFITAIAMLGAAVSCKKGGESESAAHPAVQAELLAYKEAKIAMADDFGFIHNVQKRGDRIMIFGEGKAGECLIYVTDKTFKEHTTIDFTPKEGEVVQSACIDHLGRVTVLTTAEGAAKLYIYGSVGVLNEEVELGEVIPPDSGVTCTLYTAGDGYIINMGNENLAYIDSDRTYAGDVDTRGGMIFGCCNDADDSAMVLIGGDDGEIARIDGLTLTDKVSCGRVTSTAYSLCAGDEKYPYVGNFMDGMFGFDGEKWVKITDYMDNTFSSYEIWNIVALGDGEYAAAKYDSMFLLSERDISEIKPRKTVTLASIYEGGPCKDLVKAFNAENEDYKVEIVVYNFGDDTTPYDQRMQQLKRDIATGDAPDVVTDFIPGLDPSVYYYDCAELLKDDPELNADDFIPGLLDGISFKGKIPVIFPCFRVNGYLGKTKFVGEKEKVTYDEFIEIYNNLPEGVDLFKHQDLFEQWSFFTACMNYDELLDYDKGECHFDSPEVAKMLKFIKENHIGLTQDEFEAYMKSIEGETIYWSNDIDYRLDKAAIYTDGLFGPGNAVQTLHAQFDESVTLIGSPSISGANTHISAPWRFSIMRNAEELEGAWEFIKFAFREDNTGSADFSVLEERFERQMEWMKNVTYTDETGEHSGGRYAYDYDRHTEQWKYLYYDSLTDEEAARLEAYIRDSVQRYSWREEEVDAIIIEEVQEYFNSDRSAEKTAEILQNRLSIYMSENYG